MAVSVTLNMGISDGIEVATIPFNQTTILEMKATPMTFDNVSRVMTVKKSVKKPCCKFRVFVLLIKPVAFCYFLISVVFAVVS